MAEGNKASRRDGAEFEADTGPAWRR